MTVVKPPTREREQSISDVRVGTPVTDPQPVREPQNRALVAIVSLMLFAVTGLLIFTDQANTLLKQVFCLFSFSFSMGGLYNLFYGEAQIKFSRWFKASGGIAVAVFLLVLILHSARLIRLKLPDLTMQAVGDPSPHRVA